VNIILRSQRYWRAFDDSSLLSYRSIPLRSIPCGPRRSVECYACKPFAFKLAVLQRKRVRRGPAHFALIATLQRPASAWLLRMIGKAGNNAYLVRRMARQEDPPEIGTERACARHLRASRSHAEKRIEPELDGRDRSSIGLW